MPGREEAQDWLPIAADASQSGVPLRRPDLFFAVAVAAGSKLPARAAARRSVEVEPSGSYEAATGFPDVTCTTQSSPPLPAAVARSPEANKKRKISYAQDLSIFALRRATKTLS